MQMYSEGLAANAAMIRGSNVPIETPSMEQHSEVKRTRRPLFVLLGINLVLYVIGFLFVIHSYAASDSLATQSPHSSTQLTAVIVALMYYGFGLLVTYRYYQTGLLVFTLLGFIALILTSLLVIFLSVSIIHIVTHEGFANAGIIVAIIFVAICTIALILQVLIVFYSWKLYKLLKTNKRLTIEQI